jgi:hypothetical protein
MSSLGIFALASEGRHSSNAPFGAHGLVAK